MMMEKYLANYSNLFDNLLNALFCVSFFQEVNMS
ncbi:hypothetical protein Metho_0216 [Methanomethylovorans hollandica DSM 15978]|uniref:Uncharacterized protein n=1 Tax=Methanomethylovorans hollandica (strain DSM 15978 / NBRC 107637 / DMS1) TaxID=867904 RepID=L0KUY0_METHD|nr:hypothetical protein Metho_0216 [Methanomethylovorans hollandica DSM 15978]